MALDESNHRLFIGCRKPPRLVVFDTQTGKPAANAEISGDTDDLFYDSKLKRIYVSCGEGFIDIVEQQSANDYPILERIPTRSGARTSFFSPDRSEFYLAVPQQGAKSAELRIYTVAGQ